MKPDGRVQPARSRRLPARGAERYQSLSELSLEAETRGSSRPRKAAEALARRIQAEVIAGGWEVGAYLGSEPDLLARYDVSRSVLREAIRLLEHNSVARMRTGPGGGLVVTAPDASAVANAAALFLDYQRVRPADLHNARLAIELKCVDLAIERLTPDDEHSLRAAIEHESGYAPVEFVERSHELHELIAELSGDPALMLFTKVMVNLTGEHAGPPAEESQRASPHLPKSRHDHAAIADAIIRRDREAARACMVEHLEWMTDRMEARRREVTSRRRASAG